MKKREKKNDTLRLCIDASDLCKQFWRPLKLCQILSLSGVAHFTLNRVD